MMTTFPVKNSSRAPTMRPPFGALTGRPSGLAKSAPPCGFRRSPLKMLRVPNRLFAGSGTGGTNARVQSRLGGEAAEDPAQERAVALDAQALRLRRIDEVRRNRERPGRERLRLDDNRPRHPKRSGREARLDRCDIGRRLLIEIDPDQRAPAAVSQEEGGRMAAEQLDVDIRRRAVHTHREHDELSGLQRARIDRRREARRFHAAALRPGTSRRYQQHDDRGDCPFKPHRSGIGPYFAVTTATPARFASALKAAAPTRGPAAACRSAPSARRSDP